jgi:membrane-bound lytic murein transglycosylase D
MQDHTKRPAHRRGFSDERMPARRERPSGFLRRVLDSFLGRNNVPLGGRSWTPLNTIPIVAVSVFGVAFLKAGDVERTVTVEEAFVEVDALSGIEVNDRVLKWMRRYITTDRRTFEVYLAREGAFSPLIRDKLNERGMPENLIYLAMIESGFSTKATSPVGAGGVWQFMGPTAEQYGLRVDRWVDERRDPVKATDAALDYLQWLQERYGSWFLAAAAYNAGYGRVDQVLKKHAGGSRNVKGDEDIYWEIIDHLPRETRDYVPKMLAAMALANQAQRYGFQVRPQRAYEFDRVWVQGGTSLATVADEVGIQVALLRELNPHLLKGVTPPGTSYALRVPVGRTADVMAALGNVAPSANN